MNKTGRFTTKDTGVDNRAPLRYCKTGKPMYDKKTAVSAKNKRYKQDHVELRVFHCAFCNHHHLTSQFNKITDQYDTKKKSFTENRSGNSKRNIPKRNRDRGYCRNSESN